MFVLVKVCLLFSRLVRNKRKSIPNQFLLISVGFFFWSFLVTLADLITPLLHCHLQLLDVMNSFVHRGRGTVEQSTGLTLTGAGRLKICLILKHTQKNYRLTIDPCLSTTPDFVEAIKLTGECLCLSHKSRNISHKYLSDETGFDAKTPTTLVGADTAPLFIKFILESNYKNVFGCERCSFFPPTFCLCNVLEASVRKQRQLIISASQDKSKGTILSGERTPSGGEKR